MHFSNMMGPQKLTKHPIKRFHSTDFTLEKEIEHLLNVKQSDEEIETKKKRKISSDENKRFCSSTSFVDYKCLTSLGLFKPWVEMRRCFSDDSKL